MLTDPNISIIKPNQFTLTPRCFRFLSYVDDGQRKRFTASDFAVLCGWLESEFSCFDSAEGKAFECNLSLDEYIESMRVLQIPTVETCEPLCTLTRDGEGLIFSHRMESLYEYTHEIFDSVDAKLKQSQWLEMFPAEGE